MEGRPSPLLEVESGGWVVVVAQRGLAPCQPRIPHQPPPRPLRGPLRQDSFGPPGRSGPDALASDISSSRLPYASVCGKHTVTLVFGPWSRLQQRPKITQNWIKSVDGRSSVVKHPSDVSSDVFTMCLSLRACVMSWPVLQGWEVPS